MVIDLSKLPHKMEKLTAKQLQKATSLFFLQHLSYTDKHYVLGVFYHLKQFF